MLKRRGGWAQVASAARSGCRGRNPINRKRKKRARR